jgi:ABC-type transporter Mla maintaining outer membrane lipid asymmetry permease subunit MlaE
VSLEDEEQRLERVLKRARLNAQFESLGDIAGTSGRFRLTTIVGTPHNMIDLSRIVAQRELFGMQTMQFGAMRSLFVAMVTIFNTPLQFQANNIDTILQGTKLQWVGCQKTIVSVV